MLFSEAPPRSQYEIPLGRPPRRGTRSIVAHPPLSKGLKSRLRRDFERSFVRPSPSSCARADDDGGRRTTASNGRWSRRFSESNLDVYRRLSTFISSRYDAKETRRARAFLSLADGVSKLNFCLGTYFLSSDPCPSRSTSFGVVSTRAVRRERGTEACP